MKIEGVSAAQVRSELRRRIKGWGNLKRFARICGCSDSFVAQIASGYKEPCGVVLKELGYKAITVYVKIGK